METPDWEAYPEALTPNAKEDYDEALTEALYVRTKTIEDAREALNKAWSAARQGLERASATCAEAETDAWLIYDIAIAAAGKARSMAAAREVGERR